MTVAQKSSAAPSLRAVLSPEQIAFLVCLGAYFAGVSLNGVLIPWVVRHDLHLDAAHLGMANAALSLPMAVLVLLGGMAADRVERRRLLVICHFIVCLPPLMFGLAILLGHESYVGLLVSLFGVGLSAAFLNPTRDAMLNVVARGRVQALVPAVVGVQFAVQLVGFGIAATLAWLSAGALFVVQATFWILGGLLALRLPQDIAQPQGAGTPSKRLGGEGLGSILAVAGILSFFGTGAYLIVVPLRMLDEFRAGAFGLTMASIVYCVGTIGASFTLLKRGGFRSGHGRKLGVVMALMAAFLAALGAPIPVPAFLLVLLIFGIVTGVMMSLLRSFVQMLADRARLGRVMSIYNLGVLGGSAAGAATIGIVAKHAGTMAVAVGSGVLLMLLIGVFYFVGRMGRLELIAG